MIFIFEPQNAVVQPPTPDTGSNLDSPIPNNNMNEGASDGGGGNPIYQEGLFTYTLTQGANIIAPNPTPAIGMIPPTTMGITGSVGAGITIAPSSAIDGLGSAMSSGSTGMVVTRPANPTFPTPIPTPTSTSAIQGDSPSSSAAGPSDTKEKSEDSNNNSTMTYNHTTLIIIIVLSSISILAVGIWYFRKSRTKKMLVSRNGLLADLESSVQEKRISISKAISNNLINGSQRRSWIRLNEEIETIEEKQRQQLQEQNGGKTEKERELPFVLDYPPSSMNHQNQDRSRIQDEEYMHMHGYSIKQDPAQVYDYNNTNANITTNDPSYIAQNMAQTQSQLLRNSLSSSTYTINKRNSTINHFPVPPSGVPVPIPELPPLPPTPQSKIPQDRGYTLTKRTSKDKNENIFESPEDIDNENVLYQITSPEIGVATTTCLPASSSRSAIATDTYPGRSLTGSGREIAKMTKEERSNDLNDRATSSSNSPKRQSLPYVIPIQEAERTPTFISLEQIPSQKKTPEYRSPTESLYIIYNDK